jgi:hypothetical protein
MRPTILHEAAHALGFIHEHQRSGRDSFIKSNPAVTNIDATQLAIIPNSLAYGPFDISSITLYSGAFFKLDGSATGEPYAYSMVFNPPLFPVELKGDQLYYLGPAIAEPGVHEVWVQARSAASGKGLLHPVRIEVLPRDTLTPIEINQTTAISCRTCLPFIRTYGQGDGTEWKAPVSMWFYPRLADTDKFEWRFADGVTAETNVVIREFKTPRSFEVFVKVTTTSGQIKEERYGFRVN